MPGLKKPGRAFTALVAAGSCFFMLASPGCKSTTSPEDTLSSIVVYNYCGATVTPYLDGIAQPDIGHTGNATIGNVAAGSRLIEIKKTDDGLLILTKTLDIAASSTVSLTVEGVVLVHVTNQYGEILSIYDGDSYVGDIGDQISQTIRKVTFGTHVYQAKKKSDATVVAELTIEVTDLSEHVWTITP
jgi:hypothetical protein